MLAQITDKPKITLTFLLISAGRYQYDLVRVGSIPSNITGDAVVKTHTKRQQQVTS